MNKQQLAQKIWASANQMRSKIEANEYKDYILGFIFYKYLSDKEIKFLKENDYDDELLKTVSEEDDETVKWVQENIGYFIAYKDLFSTWLSMGKDFDVSNVRDALSAFSRLISNTHKKVFDKVFDTLQTGLSKLGDSSGSQTKAISGLLTLIKVIPMDGKQDYDVLGFIYEYLTIESLSDEQALDLLEKKWIAPLIESIHKLPDTVIDSLVSKIQALQNKYATTFFEVEQQISETEATLSGMIDDLEGNEYDMLGLKELKKLLGGSAE